MSYKQEDQLAKHDPQARELTVYFKKKKKYIYIYIYIYIYSKRKYIGERKVRID